MESRHLFNIAVFFKQNSDDSEPQLLSLICTVIVIINRPGVAGAVL